ncbi:MAG: bifunctional aconitate hydratase 2/2-methylisocitrate dehydratase [Gammaproteobacteria bacterium]|jgi:aconitate hydratase 2 / 2-methylisocitrate dehydratase|nr:bifunctional aconitate hydratase 2/2-methylisocitrate dehydratase [Gammaproteobacteria bacterium]MBT7306843.1 bifunctional aconitate hydratase 2/2-methylisocitrate dehydratase [Gammaproteobacteria bacterium]
MLKAYQEHVESRATEGVPPLPLNAAQVAELVVLLEADNEEGEQLLELLTQRVPAGVDEAAEVKAAFLSAIVSAEKHVSRITPLHAIELLGTMLGGFNVAPLIAALDRDEPLATAAAAALAKTLLLFDAFDQVVAKMVAGNPYAKQVVESWAAAEWFTARQPLAEKITVTVFRVSGETNTDDLSPAQDAWSRPDIPLHAKSMLKMPRADLIDEPLRLLETLKEKGFPLAYVGDVVGTGSSRKSATNSVLWHMGSDLPYIPNKRGGGYCLGGKIAPIFLNTMEDAGALPIELDVSTLEMGDVIDLYPYEGVVKRQGMDEVLTRFTLNTEVLMDEVQAGGRIPLIIGRGLTGRACTVLGLDPSAQFRSAAEPVERSNGYTLAQKIVGKACGKVGVRPGEYCEPTITTVGSQDTTGPMTRDELKDLACLEYSADLVMQSFCHTAAYPRLVDVQVHQTLPTFMSDRGGVSLQPGDGVIHSWLNRMLLPDTVGTGGDSHTRFPLGISFPAGSGLVAFAAATGVMPLDMPESVRVRFRGEMQPGITLRDLVHAIPYVAIQQGLLTVEKAGKKNIFSGAILEIEGLEDLTVEQAFELADASAERSAAACTIALSEHSVKGYLHSNIALLKSMVEQGYQSRVALERRIEKMEAWLEQPELIRADKDAEYAALIEIDLAEISEPILSVPNDPDDVRLLSEVAGVKVDEVFVGSCMTNIGHFRAVSALLESVDQLPTRLWVAPPTRMDEAQLRREGVYSLFGRVGARVEMPGCSLCMGNQARIAPQSTAVSTSTRNFPNRLGSGADVYLASAELAAVAALSGRLPTPEEYQQYAAQIDQNRSEIYRYLDFSVKLPL